MPLTTRRSLQYSIVRSARCRSFVRDNRVDDHRVRWLAEVNRIGNRLLVLDETKKKKEPTMARDYLRTRVQRTYEVWQCTVRRKPVDRLVGEKTSQQSWSGLLGWRGTHVQPTNRPLNPADTQQRSEAASHAIRWPGLALPC